MIQNRQRRVSVSLESLEGFLSQVCLRLRVSPDALEVCFVSDAAIARWNQEYRGKPGPTDVLSFSADGAVGRNGGGSSGKQRAKKILRPREIGESGRLRSAAHARNAGIAATNSTVPDYLGDIAISPETARRNARRFGRTLPQELKILLLHGVLHLMGYDHETDSGQMERCESRLRRRLGLA
ncbi:MAG: rRNA maturation RNase YbeY [Candidatus Acidiferrales bacterium]